MQSALEWLCMTVWSSILFSDCNSQAKDGSDLLIWESITWGWTSLPVPALLKGLGCEGHATLLKTKACFLILTISTHLDKLKMYIVKLSELLWAIFVQREEHMPNSKTNTVNSFLGHIFSLTVCSYSSSFLTLWNFLIAAMRYGNLHITIE